MSRLWTPPTAKLAGKSSLPEPDAFIRLGDGRHLKYLGPWKFGEVSAQAWTSKDGMRVLVSLDATTHGDLLHLSVSRARTLPSWKDVSLLKDAFFGENRDAMMMLPTKEDFVNLHEYTLHIWETPERWGIQ